jgi:O-antigen chain-terminating methyltransferase
LDRSVRPPTSIPDPELPLDEQKIAALNESWNILPAPPEASGFKGRLASFVWRTIGPYLQRQLSFNALVVEHVNRDAEARRVAHRRDCETVGAIRGEMHQLTAFQGRLLVLLQQITPYVDTKDREAVSGIHVLNTTLSSFADAQNKYRESIEARERRYHTRTSDIANAQGELQKSANALNAAFSSLADAYGKYRETLEAREHRYEARTAAIAAAQEDLRRIVSVNQQAIVALKRALQGPQVPGTAGPQVHGSSGPEVPGSSGLVGAFESSLDAYKYVGFEDQFRGTREAILQRLDTYIPYFTAGPPVAAPKADVLDVGCGRGEFLDLLAAQGVPARGIDINHEMVEVCRARGLNVVQSDAVTYLTSLPDDSLGGVFAAQVVEHLDPSYLLRFLELAFEKLQPGGRLVLETINPACWTAFFESYIRDITHRCALHPETLKYLALASGFSRAEIDFRTPVPPQDRLQPVAVWEGADEAIQDLAATFNGNVEKLNARMFTHMDYAVIAEKG